MPIPLLLTLCLLAAWLFINFQIIGSDYFERKIPNKYLGVLLIIAGIFLFTQERIDSIFLMGSMGVFIFCFSLYSAGVWAAGDAKYFFVLSLFLPLESLFTYIGNIGISILTFLLISCLWFYIRFLRYKGELYLAVKKDIHDRLLKKYYDTHGNFRWNEVLIVIGKFGGLFLLIFIVERLLRNMVLLSLDDVFIYMYSYKNSGIFFLGIILSFLIVFGKKLLFFYILQWKQRIPVRFHNSIYLGILFALLVSIYFLIHNEYLHNGEMALHSTFYTLILSLGLFLSFRLLVWAYTLYFKFSGETLIDIQSLKRGDIIDMKFLLEMFRGQDDFFQDYPQYSLSFLKSLRASLDEEQVNKLQMMYQDLNYYHSLGVVHGFHPLKVVKVLYDFNFSLFICAGFIVTYLFGNHTFSFILSSVFSTDYNLWILG